LDSHEDAFKKSLEVISGVGRTRRSLKLMVTEKEKLKRKRFSNWTRTNLR
jgi:hypothetical protein